MKSKKRILFVDDEALVLQGLKRMLHARRSDWDMEFAQSGAEALRLMAAAAFDVIVSDMRMPGMSGAELLNEVMHRHPKTARLILSGHADRELTLRCVSSTHQFLSKPCEPAALEAAVTRATSLEDSPENSNVMALVAKIEKLPSLPSLYTDIVRCLQSPDVSMEEVGRIVAQDIGMTAQILKLVNSAFFGLGREISSASEAASYLGADILKALVLSLDVFAQFESSGVAGLSVESLWTHSLNTAAAAKIIAKSEGAVASTVEEVFVAGLLHDTGKLVLMFSFPERYTEAVSLAQNRSLTLYDAEREVFGTSHAEVGGHLLDLWGLPVPVVAAITLHHLPSASTINHFCALTATHVANVLVQEGKSARGGSQCEVDRAYLKALGLEERLPAWTQAVRESLANSTRSTRPIDSHSS